VAYHRSTVGFCEHDNESSGSIEKTMHFSTAYMTYVLKEDYAS
jgi:hypothetical protein